MNSKVSVLFLLLLFLAACAGSVQADIVRLRTGEVYEGKVKMSGGADCEIRLRDGKVVRIYRANIESIEEGPCSWEVYAEKASACDYSDAKAIMALVEFCGEKGLWEEWHENLEKTIEVDPDNKTARLLLDHKKKDNEWVEKDLSNGDWSAKEYLRSGFVLDKKKRKWLSPDEAKRAAGFILFRGEWKSKTEIRKIIADEEAELERSVAGKSLDEILTEAFRALDSDRTNALYRLVIKRDMKYSKAYGNYIVCLLETYGDINGAETVLAEAKKQKVYDQWIANGEAAIYFHKFDFKNTEKYAAKSLNIYPAFMTAIYYSGIAKYYRGDLIRAEKVLREYFKAAGSPTGHRQRVAASLICSINRMNGNAKAADAFITVEYGGAIYDHFYNAQLAALTKSKEELLVEIGDYLKEYESVELRDIRRRLLRIDPVFNNYRDDPNFLKFTAPEGSDTSGWNPNEVGSEDISEKEIRNASKAKKRTFDMTGLTGRWGGLKTDSFVFFSNSSRPQIVELGNRLEKFVQILNAVLGSKVKKGGEPILRIFRTKAEYSKYVSSYFRTLSLSAYYNPSSEEVVTWAPKINALDSVMPDIYAACVKQRLYADFGAPLPVWLTEGTGLYFSTTKYNAKEFRLETGAPHREYVQAFKRMHPAGQPAPDLAFFFTQTRLGLERTGVEGQAGKADLWGFMYFLMKSPDENVKKILPDYFAAIRGKKEQKEALKAIYANIDRQTLSGMIVKFINEQ